MVDFGNVRPGRTIDVYFESFASSTGAPITITGLATSDILVYKNGGTTQRASASGFTLLDTDGIDFDSITGIHGFSVDLSDNTTASFWEAGARYHCVVSAITVDGQTMSFNAASWRIGYDDAIRNTTIATLSSQTSFTLTAGPTNDNAFKGCRVIVQSITGASVACGVISAYTGSTKTVTLAFDPGAYTMAAGDNISVFPPDYADVRFWLGTAPSTPSTAGVPAVDVVRVANTAQTAGDLAALINTVDDYLDTEVAAIKAKTDNLPSDPADASDIAASFSTVNSTLSTIAGYIDTEVAAIKAKTDNLPADPADASDIAAAFTTVNTKLDTIDDFLDTEVAAIKAKTDNLPASPAATGDAMALTSSERNSTADAILTRSWTSTDPSMANTGFNLLNAARLLRNEWSTASGSLEVYGEDGSTLVWDRALTTDAAADPITGTGA